MEGDGDGATTSRPTCGDCLGLYCLDDWRVQHMSRPLFVDSKLCTAYMNRTSYIQKLRETCNHRPLIAQAISGPSVFKMELHFNTFEFLAECMRTRLCTVHNYNSGMRLEYAMQVKMKAWNARRRAAGLGRIQMGLHHYMFYNNCTEMFEDIRSYE